MHRVPLLRLNQCPRLPENDLREMQPSHRETGKSNRLSMRSLLVVVLLASIGILVTALNGCKGSNESGGDSAAAIDPDLTATDILAKTRRAYADAKTYSDRGKFILRYDLEGGPRQEDHPFELAYSRPGEIALTQFNTSLMSNGSELAFAVNDPATNHMDQQVVVHDVDGSVDVVELFKDPIVGYFAAGGAEIPVAQGVEQAEFELSHPALALLDSMTTPSWYRDASHARRLTDDSINDQACYRIQLTATYGNYVLWVDPQSWLIRRFEFPAALLDEQLSESARVTNLRMFADLIDCSTETEFNSESFVYQLPKASQKVRHFVTLPEPFPSQLVGKPIDSFQFPLTNGNVWQSHALRDSITAMLWVSMDPVCGPVVEQFSRMRDQFAQQSSPLQMLVVSTDTIESASDDVINQQVRHWGFQGNIARASQSIGLGVFDIRTLPTIIVFDQQGKVQFFKTIDDGQLELELSSVIHRVSQGEDVAQEMRREYQRYLEQYQEQVQLAGVDARQVDSDQTVRHVAAPSSPNQIRLTELWKNNSFQAAGNIVPLARGSETSLAIMDGFQTVVELDLDGNQVDRFVLDLPGNQPITAVDVVPDGKDVKYIGSSVLAQRLYGFNENWELIETYPYAQAERHSGIRSHTLVKDSETIKLAIGYWQSKGIELFDLEGNVTGQVNDIPQVNSIVPVHNVGSLGATNYLVASNNGQLLLFDGSLETIDDSPFANELVQHVFKGQDGDHQQLIGLSSLDNRNMLAFGFDEQFHEKWRETISANTFSHEIRFVVFGSIPAANSDEQDEPIWAIARPDGTIHLGAADGGWSDRFSLGFSPKGIALSERDGSSLLVVTDGSVVTSWSISRLDSRSANASDQDGQPIR